MKKLSRILSAFIFILLINGCKIFPPHFGYIPPPEHVPMDIEPRWSPDGRYLLYTRVDTVPDSTSGIKIHDLETGESWFLLKGFPWDYFNPRWSPDGRCILFNHGGDAIYKARLTDSLRIDKRSIQFVVEGNNPDWSPCGDLIAFDRIGDSGGIWLTDTIGSRVWWIFRGAQHSWGPCDGRLLTFNVIIDTAGKILKEFQFDPGSGSFDWSASGKYIVFERNPTEPRGIYVIDTLESKEVKLYDSNNREYSYPSFSPTSEEIAFNSWNPEHTKIVLWIIGRDGKNLRQVTF